MTVVVNISGLILIALIIWWFWLAEARAQAIDTEQADQPIEILVQDGVYQPANLRISAGQDVVLRFVRKDASPCAEKVIFSDLDRTFELPVDRPVDINLNISEPGKYTFTCEMQMYRGSLQVI